MIALLLPLLWNVARRAFAALAPLSARAAPLLSAALPKAAPWALAAALVVASLVAGALWLRLDAAQAERDALRAERARLAASLQAQDQALAARDAAIAALSAEAEAAARRAQALSLARQEVIDAPQGDDGAVAPVLGRALERLRRDPRP